MRRSRGGRWRGKGRQAPRVRREYKSTKNYLERFAPDVNAGCGGLSSLRATAAPLLKSDVRGVALLASFRNEFRRLLSEFRRFSSPDGAEIQENPIHQAKFQEFSRRSVAKSEPRASPKLQGGPKGEPRGTSWLPGGSQRSHRRPSEAPRRHLGDHFGASTTEKVAIRKLSVA